MSDAYNALFLCTGNSARSIIAESILNTEGKGLFKAHSAGSQPKGAVHPMALKVLDAMGYPNKGLCSKSWDVCASSYLTSRYSERKEDAAKLEERVKLNSI